MSWDDLSFSSVSPDLTNCCLWSLWFLKFYLQYFFISPNGCLRLFNPGWSVCSSFPVSWLVLKIVILIFCHLYVILWLLFSVHFEVSLFSSSSNCKWSRQLDAIIKCIFFPTRRHFLGGGTQVDMCSDFVALKLGLSVSGADFICLPFLLGSCC